MDPKVWGPHVWIFLHSITLNYPLYPAKTTRNHHYNFFMNLIHIIPCDKCRIHYKQNLIKYPLTKKILSSRENLIKWLINVHNSVNKMTGEKIMSYDEVINMYNNMYNKQTPNKFNYKYIFIIIIIILAILCVFWRTK